MRSLITFPQKRLLKKYAVTQNAAIVVMALNAIAVLSVVGIWAMIAAMLLI
ncbi:TPA: hypothetical protein QIW60_005042 [Escherichia coli]|nr:hypothetical protein [Shigella flexneri]EKW4703794.1 hypothetical protein [Escherichia coli]KAF0655395.1 membrane protein [Salmonella enterica subsp. enterica serovar Worthington str. BCH-7253]KAF0671832.1 membrane protein [Salmonella enterica subsp. enterica serovar Worthington str. BCH-3194]KAF0789053.1 membrane protein [Salmonella enterica subsp. enterica serovar Worthington str. BCH-5715]HCY4330318.1 hypothetical protein [Shigella sonnei]